MKNRKLFCDYPHIGYNEIYVQSHFFKWLQDNRKDTFIECLKEYLGINGFDIKKHFIHESQVRRFRYVFENQWYNSDKYRILKEKLHFENWYERNKQKRLF